MKHRVRNIPVTVIAVTALTMLAPLLYIQTQTASALQILTRSLELSDPQAGNVSDYDFNFTVQSVTDLGSLRFRFCDESPVFDDPCTASPGFDASSAILSSQSGETGFTIHPSSDANNIVLTRTPAAPTNFSLGYLFSNITNQSAAQETSYVRISSYNTDDGTGPRLDEGGIAYTSASDVSVELFVPPYMEFCVGVTITGVDCNTAVGSFIDLGVFTEVTTATATSQFAITTNAAGGFGITMTGPTLTSGNNFIQNLVSPTSSVAGQSQFGINLRANSFPGVGAEPLGLGYSTPTSNYNTPNLFRYFVTSEIVNSTSPDATNYTISYITNIDENTLPGVYNTTFFFTALATF